MYFDTLTSILADESSDSAIRPVFDTVENGTPTEWASYDPNEPRYCLCNQVSYGEMVACDNEDVSSLMQLI